MLSHIFLAMLMQASPADRTAATDVQRYLATKEREFSERTAAARSQGAEAQVTAVLQSLEQKGAFASADVLGQTEPEKAAVRDALRKTAAHDLVATGLGPDALQGPNAAAALAAIERVTTKRETLADLLTLGERILIAEVASDKPDAPSRLGQEIPFTVVEVLKGAQGPALFTLGAHMSRPFASAAKGQRYLFFVSPSLARFKQAGGRRLAGPGTAFQFAPYAILNERLVAVYDGQTDPRGASVADVRAALGR